jgi:hypothetical protein
MDGEVFSLSFRFDHRFISLDAISGGAGCRANFRAAIRQKNLITKKQSNEENFHLEFFGCFVAWSFKKFPLLFAGGSRSNAPRSGLR